MLVIADSSALIALGTCEGLDLILQVFDDIRVPKAVYQEVVVEGKPQSAALKAFLSERVAEVDVTHWVLAAGGLGQGEIEAMALARIKDAIARRTDRGRIRIIGPRSSGLRFSSVDHLPRDPLGGFGVVRGEGAVDDEVAQVVFDRRDPAAGWAVEEAHQVVAVERALQVGEGAFHLQAADVGAERLDALGRRALFVLAGGGDVGSDEVEQVIEDGVEIRVWRIPRLQKVMV